MTNHLRNILDLALFNLGNVFKFYAHLFLVADSLNFILF